MIIESGSSGVKAEVNNDNHLLTHAITNCDCKINSIKKAQAYEFAIGDFVAVTTTAEHAIFYIKNTSSTKRLHIDDIRTCGTSVQKWLLYKNDTGGTLISDANAGIEINHNFASSNVADADLWVGSAAGKTRSGGVIMSQHINDIGSSIISYKGSLILGQNDSLTLTVQNVTTGTNEACVRISAYYEEIT